jgi:transcriptional regulator with XRE-family HTH domain
MIAESARLVLGNNLRMHRAKRKWSQERLALEAQLHRTFLAHTERGAKNISLDNIEKLARALEVDVWELLKPEAT